jgi:SAM-dependent methyltransferase
MIPCELCGQKGPHAPWFPELGIVRCSSCGLIFFDGRVEPGALYDSRYFDGGEYHDYKNEKRSQKLNFRQRVRDLLKRVPPGGKLLEIGCAYGYFLEEARLHWRSRGIDIASEAILHAAGSGLDVECVDFLSLPDQPESFDLICLWDTIEHLPHPIRTIERAARWLKPGGFLAISTGDIESRIARWRGPRWRQIHPPTHLYYFSPTTLNRAFEKSGLVMDDLRHPGQFRSYSAMVSKILARRPGQNSWMSSLATWGGRLDFPMYLNLWDLMVATARKPSHARTDS